MMIGGAVALGLGIWACVDKTFVNELLGTNLYIGAIYIIIATGAIICFIAFFGCLGAAKEVRCMLMTYFIMIFIIFVVMLIGGILGYVFREKVQDTIRQEMESSIKQYGSNREITEAWDETQRTLKCCGVNGYYDWQHRLPSSCCLPGIDCQQQRAPSTVYPDGCAGKTVEFVKENAAIIGGAGIGVACLMLLGMIFSCALFKMLD